MKISPNSRTSLTQLGIRCAFFVTQARVRIGCVPRQESVRVSQNSASDPLFTTDVCIERTNMTTRELSTDKLVTNLRRVVEDSEEILKSATGVVTDKSGNMRDRLAHTIQSAKDAAHKLEQKGVACAKATDKAIRDNPYKSLAIALAVGVAAGYLLKRK